MNIIDPTHPQLRRVHVLEADTVASKKQSVDEWLPVLLEWRRVVGREYIIVWNGNHRMQAALELGLPSIAYELVDKQRLAEELQRTPFRDPAAFLRRMRPFEVGVYS